MADFSFVRGKQHPVPFTAAGDLKAGAFRTTGGSMLQGGIVLHDVATGELGQYDSGENGSVYNGAVVGAVTEGDALYSNGTATLQTLATGNTLVGYALATLGGAGDVDFALKPLEPQPGT